MQAYDDCRIVLKDNKTVVLVLHFSSKNPAVQTINKTNG